MSDPKQMYSLSFLSDDAERVEDGYQFTISSAIARVKPTRVMLASVELPLSQQSIEEQWSRVHFIERLHITRGARTFSVQMQGESGAGARLQKTEAVAVLPLHLNEIAEARFNAATRMLNVRCEEPHGLYAYGRCMLPFMAAAGDAEVLACASGSYRLLELHGEDRLQLVDDHAFAIHIPSDQPHPPPSSSGVLHVPSPTSFSSLAKLLEAYVRQSPIQREVNVSYSRKENVLVVEAPQYPTDARSVVITLGGDELARRVGVTAGMTKRFMRDALGASTLPTGDHDPSLSMRQLMLGTGNHGAQQSDIPPLRVPTPPIAWPYVRLRPGHYAPSKKMHTPSPPQRIHAEIDVQFNRFLVRRQDDGLPPAMVFIDPSGNARVADIVPGRYSADGLAAQLTATMSSNSGGAKFAVTFSGSAFTIACVNSGISGLSRTFSLLFGHPRMLSASRLGFDDITYDGASSYTSSHLVSVPQMQWPRSDSLRHHVNLYQLSEDASRARMRFVPVAAQPVVGKLDSITPTSLAIKCFAAGRAVSHGFGAGTVVTLASPPGAATVELGGEEVQPVPPGVARGVVGDGDAAEPHVLVVRLHSPPAWASATGRAVAVSVPLEPVSICFHPSLPNGIGHRLGFEPRAYEHGLDGITQPSDAQRQPPYYAPNVYDLDHPDFVLMYLHEGKRTSLTHHYTKGVASLPFAKVVLYPVYREERALMRETVLSSGESMNKFTIDLRNPDGLTPYQLNGARFSFTLNFIQ